MSLISSLWRVHTYVFGAMLAFAAVVETAHMRRYIAEGPKDRVIFTAIAAGAALYMASECLEGNWPSWRGHGYD